MHQFVAFAEMTADEMKKKRNELGLTQKELAEFVGVSKPTIERWETSDKAITGPIVPLLRLLDAAYIESCRIPDRRKPIRLWYMYKNIVCTMIDVDERNKAIEIKNFTKKNQFKAFGVNERPTFADYEEFLKSRCFPPERDKLKLVLKDLDLPFYDPFMIIEKTEGRMAEDDFWIKVEK